MLAPDLDFKNRYLSLYVHSIVSVDYEKINYRLRNEDCSLNFGSWSKKINSKYTHYVNTGTVLHTEYCSMQVNKEKKFEQIFQNGKDIQSTVNLESRILFCSLTCNLLHFRYIHQI